MSKSKMHFGPGNFHDYTCDHLTDANEILDFCLKKSKAEYLWNDDIDEDHDDDDDDNSGDD